MGLSRLKLVAVLGALIWGVLLIYLFSNADEFNKYKGKFNDGVKWAGHFLPSDIISPANNSLPSTVEPKSSGPQVNIVMQTNEENLGGLITAVYSVVNNSRGNIHFHFIVPSSIETHLKLWMQNPNLSKVAYSVKALPKNLEDNPRIGKIIFANLFPELHGPVIYLDSDLIVQGDILELLKFDIPENSLGLFSDDCHTGASSKTRSSRGDNRYGKKIQLQNNAVLKIQKKLGIHISVMACTFSTGVFVASDANLWRHDIFQKASELLEAHKNESLLGPQGGNDEVEAALLVILYKRTTPLDPLWHVRQLGMTSSNSRYSVKYLTNAKLIHWSGHFKPWSRQAPEQGLWDRYFVGIQPDPLGKFKPIRRIL